MGNLTFGEAVELLKSGKMVQRSGWNGKGMFLFQADVLDFGASDDVMDTVRQIVEAKKETSGPVVIYGSTIAMKAADGSIVFGWLASQTDIVANDWVELG